MLKPLYRAVRILAIFLAALIAVPVLMWATSSWRTFGMIVAVALIAAVIISSIVQSFGRTGDPVEFGDGSGE